MIGRLEFLTEHIPDEFILFFQKRKIAKRRIYQEDYTLVMNLMFAKLSFKEHLRVKNLLVLKDHIQILQNFASTPVPTYFSSNNQTFFVFTNSHFKIASYMKKEAIEVRLVLIQLFLFDFLETPRIFVITFIILVIVFIITVLVYG